MFAFFGLLQYSDQGSSAFFSCALTVNEIGLLFLRQCFGMLPPSTETSISGTSRKLPLCEKVSSDVNSCYCVIGGISRGGGIVGDDVM
jgi:hypothetical protein